MKDLFPLETIFSVMKSKSPRRVARIKPVGSSGRSGRSSADAGPEVGVADTAVSPSDPAVGEAGTGLTVADWDPWSSVAAAPGGAATDAVGSGSVADSPPVEDEVQAANSTIRARKAVHQQRPESGSDM